MDAGVPGAVTLPIATPPSSSAASYRERLAARSATVAHWQRRDDMLVWARMLAAGFTVAVAVAAWRSAVVPASWVLLPAVLFGALVIANDRVRQRLARARRAAAFYERGLARLEDRWAGSGEDGLRFLDPAHPYAADLDLFGTGSLFQLLCTARTGPGEETLAAWLLAPADPDVAGASARPRSKSCATGWTCAKRWRCWARTVGRARTRRHSRPGAARATCR